LENTKNRSKAPTPDENETFRDSISTIDETGKRRWIYPEKPGGNLHNYRIVVAIILLVFLYVAPFLKMNGQPIIKLNIIAREFNLFGFTFWPQDFHIFVLAMIVGIVFIVLFTVVYGRIFCGWLCPQTVFMEMVYRKLEYLIEGNATRQKQLNKKAVDLDKLFRKSLKHILFFLIGFVTGNIFLSYIIGIEELFAIITSSPTQHLTGLVWMLVFSVVFYFVFANFREQACTLVCPYGRFQGVLLDANSIVISYDHNRGDPRGKLKEGKVAVGNGDCINCGKCYRVCPTGIDIRNGTQLECINCTACIDACNEIMDKVKLPRGLIRYASGNNIETGESRIFTVRAAGYSIVLTLLLSIILIMFVTREEIEATVLREPGTLYQTVEKERISNLYRLKVVNKTAKVIPFKVSLEGIPGETVFGDNDRILEPASIYETTLFVIANRSELSKVSTPFRLVFSGEDRVLTTVQTSFLGPVPSNSSGVSDD